MIRSDRYWSGHYGKHMCQRLVTHQLWSRVVDSHVISTNVVVVTAACHSLDGWGQGLINFAESGREGCRTCLQCAVSDIWCAGWIWLSTSRASMSLANYEDIMRSQH